MRLFLNSEMKSLHFLNITQFLGALNDNVFKFLVVFFLISLKGTENASTILAIAGGIFVVPFLLFSAFAGVLADRISKRNILVSMKIAELIIMLGSLLGIYLQSEYAVYFLLFLMAAQSAAFGPSKYGIIPEIVEYKHVSRANGLLNSLTYLAIIIGTFLASFITDITNKNFMLATLLCVIISAIGLATCIQIEKTPAQRTKKRASPFFFKDIYKTLSLTHKKPHLLWAVLGSAYFLFVGGFTQLNTIPFAIESLGLSDVKGGYLFLLTAVGIAVGSIAAGKISKDRVEIGLSSISGFFLGLLFLVLSIFSHSLFVSIIALMLLGLCGGMFLIPFDSFIQVYSPDEGRGQVIAATNALSFTGVLFASLFLYVFNSKLGFSPSFGFTVIGILTLIFTFAVTGRMSRLFLPFFVDKFLLRFYSIEVKTLPTSPCILLLKTNSLLEAFILFSLLPNMDLFRMGKKFKKFPYFEGLLKTFHLIYHKRINKDYLISLFKKSKKFNHNGFYVSFLPDSLKREKEIEQVAEQTKTTLIYVKSAKEKIHKTFLGITFKQKHITLSFFEKTK